MLKVSLNFRRLTSGCSKNKAGLTIFCQLQPPRPGSNDTSVRNPSDLGRVRAQSVTRQ